MTLVRDLFFMCIILIIHLGWFSSWLMMDVRMMMITCFSCLRMWIMDEFSWSDVGYTLLMHMEESHMVIFAYRFLKW